MAYHTATMRSIVSVASRSQPRVRLLAEIAPDHLGPAIVKGFTPLVSEGDKICLVEARLRLRNRTCCHPARTARCNTPGIVPLAN